MQARFLMFRDMPRMHFLFLACLLVAASAESANQVPLCFVGTNPMWIHQSRPSTATFPTRGLRICMQLRDSDRLSQEPIRLFSRRAAGEKPAILTTAKVLEEDTATKPTRMSTTTRTRTRGTRTFTKGTRTVSREQVWSLAFSEWSRCWKAFCSVEHLTLEKIFPATIANDGYKHQAMFFKADHGLD